MAGSLLGGQLIEILSPGGALHAAAAIAAIAPLAVMVSTVSLVDEAPAAISVAEFRRALVGFFATFRSRALWLIAAFLFLYYFSPGFATPLYFHMTDRLHFSQGLIGFLSSVSAAGWIAGGLIYHYALRGMTTRALLYLSIAAGTCATMAYLAMVDEISGVIIYFASGVAGMIATIATLTLAADYCPERSEGFAFAALMSVMNLTAPIDNTIGAFLYENVFHGQLAPLIIVSAAFTAFIVVLMPLLEKLAPTPVTPRA
jgi:hypothetical protein